MRTIKAEATFPSLCGLDEYVAMRNGHYTNRRIKGVRIHVRGQKIRLEISVEGARPLIVPIVFTERERDLRILLANPKVFLWTMSDLAKALGFDASSKRECGEVGKDLSRLGCSLKRVKGLTDARTQRRLLQCSVYCQFPIDHFQTSDIRKAYRLQAKDRLAACQQMRSRG